MAVNSVDLCCMFTEEDTYGSYGRLLLKYFCAEAVMTGHALLLSSLDYDAQQLLKVWSIVFILINTPGALQFTSLKNDILEKQNLDKYTKYLMS